ncbi:hypothetical protein B7463_g5287, partial [Scytalidium lignicola]
MVFKAVNDSVGPDGLVLILLVYSAYPHMSELDILALTISQRATAIKKAMEEISKIRAKRQVQDVINMYNGPDETQARTEAEKSHTSLNIPFRSTVVKPYLTPTEGIDGIELPEPELGTTADEEHQEEPNELTIAVAPPPVPPVKQRHGRPCKYPEITAFLQDKEPEPQFAASCQAEILGLLEKGVFETIDPQNVPNDIRIFNVSQRIILCIAVMEHKSTSLYLQDISQAYVQSTTLLNQDFYVRLPPELTEQLGLREGSILRVVKPLYGVLEAGNHWFFQTYHSHHVKALAMKPSTYDPCLLYNTEPFGVNLTTKEQYIAQCAQGVYIASVCQPEASYDLSVAAQAIDPSQEDVKSLNKRLQWQIQNVARGIQFVKLDKETLQLLVFTDASFVNNRDLSSQIGYIVALADRKGNANTLHWTSVKCKRVTRSVLALELYGMAYGFDMGAAIKSTIEGILEIDLLLVICTDSRSLYDCLVKLGTTQEKRLMIDVMCLRQAYERRQIAEVRWIEGTTNPADSMTKGKPSSALKQLLDTNKVQLEVVEWVERDGVGGGTENRTEEGFGAIPN